MNKADELLKVIEDQEPMTSDEYKDILRAVFWDARDKGYDFIENSREIASELIAGNDRLLSYMLTHKGAQDKEAAIDSLSDDLSDQLNI
jgi:hypothetical protein